ncbi:MAG: hypothetical protein J6K96_06765 [Treponema sp.]|nr:hypothetical protein [Treponema sp.]
MDETLRLAKEISKEHDKITIIILIIISIIYLIINLLIPIFLSSFNRRNEIKKIRSERKLDSTENVIKQLRLLSSSLSIIDTKNVDEGRLKINELREYVHSSELLLTKEILDVANDLLDYCEIVLVTPEERDSSKEKNFFIKMKKEYEKIL